MGIGGSIVCICLAVCLHLTVILAKHIGTTR